MPASTEPNSGIKHGWSQGEDGWETDMNNNLLLLGRIGFHLSIIDRDVTDPTTLTPSNGDRYIVAASAIGDWSGQDGNVAVYDGDAAAWFFYTPAAGWLAYIEDEAVHASHNGTAWSAGTAI